MCDSGDIRSGCMRACVRVCVRECMSVWACIHEHSRVCNCRCVYMCMYACVNIHIPIMAACMQYDDMTGGKHEHQHLTRHY